MTRGRNESRSSTRSSTARGARLATNGDTIMRRITITISADVADETVTPAMLENVAGAAYVQVLEPVLDPDADDSSAWDTFENVTYTLEVSE